MWCLSSAPRLARPNFGPEQERGKRSTLDKERVFVEVTNNPELLAVLEAAIHEEEAHKNEENYLGWEWFSVRASPQMLNHLVRLGVVSVVYKSNKSTHYRLANAKEAADLVKELQVQEQEPEEQSFDMPRDLFDVVILHEDKKQLIRKALAAEEPVHVMLVGDVSSAKTLYELELTRLPGAEYVLASSLTKAGLYDLMFTKKPRYLVIDEIDKLSDYDNVSALLSLMETGILSEVKYRRRRQQQFKTWVFAACNHEEQVPWEIRSRFGAYRLHFRSYTPDEFLEVATKVLQMREKLPKDLAAYIAGQTLNRLTSRDVRVARSIARTCKTREEVDELIKLLEKDRDKR